MTLIGEEKASETTVYFYQIKKWQEKEGFKLFENEIKREGKVSVQRVDRDC